MKTTFLFVSISLACGLLFANLYTSLVDVKSWGNDLPNSIATARNYFKSVNPGDFFRTFAPVNQVLALIALILFWKVSTTVRICLGMALVLYVLSDILTFAYFYPRNELLFNTAPLTDIALLKRIISEWSNMNWIRSLILIAGIICSCISLHKIYTLPVKA